MEDPYNSIKLIKEIYLDVAEMTLKRVKKEKATRLSRKTLKMIALTEKLFHAVSII